MANRTTVTGASPISLGAVTATGVDAAAARAAISAGTSSLVLGTTGGTAYDGAAGNAAALLAAAALPAAGALAAIGGVSTATTVNGHALSSDVTVTPGDVGLGAVTATGADQTTAQSVLFDIPFLISSFTEGNGLGTATAATGTITLPAATSTATWADAPRLTTTFPGDPWLFDLAVRLVSFTGGTSNQQASIRIAHTAASLVVQSSLATFRVFGDLGFDFWSGGGGSAVTGYTPGLIPSDGLTWIRVAISRGLTTMWTGRGATYATAVWTLRGMRHDGDHSASERSDKD